MTYAQRNADTKNPAWAGTNTRANLTWHEINLNKKPVERDPDEMLDVTEERTEAYEQGRRDGYEEGVQAGWKRAAHAVRKAKPADAELTSSDESEDDDDDEDGSS